MRLVHGSGRLVAILGALLILVSACGGGDDEAGVYEVDLDAAATDDADDESTSDGSAEATDDDTAAPDDAAIIPETGTGTVVLNGETTELTGPSRSEFIAAGNTESNGEQFDFEICETVNPAFAGEFNVGGNLIDGTRFHMSGNVDEEPGEFDGLFLGTLPDEERAEDFTVSLDGRTLSGTATTSRGIFEFTFTC